MIAGSPKYRFQIIIELILQGSVVLYISIYSFIILYTDKQIDTDRQTVRQSGR